jgi:hypothetical protein
MAIKLIVKRTGDDAPSIAEGWYTDPFISIGSDPVATIRLPSPTISPEQAIVIDEGGSHLLIARNDGVILNGEPLPREARRELRHKDVLRIGEYLVYVALDAAETVALESVPAPVGQTQPLTPPRATGALPAEPPRSNFTAILDSLRTAEDSFYVVIEGGPQSGVRKAIEGRAADIPFGWNFMTQTIHFDLTELPEPVGVLSKDWSGVSVKPLQVNAIMVNGKPVDIALRLKTGDRIAVASPDGHAMTQMPTLTFHAPTSLQVLDSIFPQTLPPPISTGPLPQPAPEAAEISPPADFGSSESPTPTLRRPKYYLRFFFGGYTAMELGIMVVGTLILSGIIFLLLEFL